MAAGGRPAPRRRYLSADEDSARWDGFPFRPGDVVVSTRSKSGTTWLQRICTLLVLGTTGLPDPLGRLSPWLDWLVEPREAVVARLAAQPHRRVIKTHTPLDGLPRDPRATYVVGVRDPLDAAVSLYHQAANIDRARLRALTGATAAREPLPPLDAWLRGWIDREADPVTALDSLPGFCHHLADAWSRRADPVVVLVRYVDLLHDLDGQMRGLAARLGAPDAGEGWPELVDAARFGRMRADAALLVPDAHGVLLDAGAFFRRGEAGEGRALLAPEEHRRYRRRLGALVPAGLLRWLDRAPA